MFSRESLFVVNQVRKISIKGGMSLGRIIQRAIWNPNLIDEVNIFHIRRFNKGTPTNT